MLPVTSTLAYLTPAQLAVQWLLTHLTDGEWISALSSQFDQLYFIALAYTLHMAYRPGNIFPLWEQFFYAFNLTPLSQVKVVILGQDPYPNIGEIIHKTATIETRSEDTSVLVLTTRKREQRKAMGLAFSVPMGVPIPQSLQNIFKELPGRHGCLTNLAQQGVFLLNSTLTVAAGISDSHAGIGWQPFTDHVIRIISHNHPHVVFILMGKHAQGKACLIDPRHTIIPTSHPSNRSATCSPKPLIFSIPIPFNGNIPMEYTFSVNIAFDGIFPIPFNGNIWIPFKDIITITLGGNIHITFDGSIPIPYKGSILMAFNGIPFNGIMPIPINGSIQVPLNGAIAIQVQVPFNGIIQHSQLKGNIPNPFNGFIHSAFIGNIPIPYTGSINIAINGIIPIPFNGSNCFSRCNNELMKHNQRQINWSL